MPLVRSKESRGAELRSKERDNCSCETKEEADEQVGVGVWMFRPASRPARLRAQGCVRARLANRSFAANNSDLESRQDELLA